MKTVSDAIPVLLTATVNPNGMRGAFFSTEERIEMYVGAIHFYINNSWKYPINLVFAENSHSINEIKKKIENNDFIEWLDVSGSEYDKSRGKGYNETILIKKAIEQSFFIKKSGCFFKVTGRLKVQNIDKLLKECSIPGLQFKADCKDHRVYDLLRLPINGHVGECRYWFASTSFFMQSMWKYVESLNDFGKEKYYAEDAMLSVCRETRGKTGCKDRFYTQARLSGCAGHIIKGGFFNSANYDKFGSRVKNYVRQLLRWTLPFWRC